MPTTSDSGWGMLSSSTSGGLSLRNTSGLPYVASVLSIPLGWPCAIFSDQIRQPVNLSSLRPSLKCRSSARTMATASAAEPPRPMPRGTSGNTSIRMPRSASPSSSRIVPAARSNERRCSGGLASSYSTPHRGIRICTPLADVFDIGTHLKWQRYRDSMTAIDHGMLAEQDYFAEANAQFRIRFFQKFRGCAGRDSINSSSISRARQTLISPLRSRRSSTLSKRLAGVPAAFTTVRAWRVMCPVCIPSVASARSAEKFCARPAAAMTSANSVADSAPSNLRFTATLGLDSSGPPTFRPSAGSRARRGGCHRHPPTSATWPYSARRRAAHACAPASIARQSLPVASATASMPFMMPLLCVAAR